MNVFLRAKQEFCSMFDVAVSAGVKVINERCEVRNTASGVKVVNCPNSRQRLKRGCLLAGDLRSRYPETLLLRTSEISKSCISRNLKFSDVIQNPDDLLPPAGPAPLLFAGWMRPRCDLLVGSRAS
jgi:hypothetical protein